MRLLADLGQHCSLTQASAGRRVTWMDTLEVWNRPQTLRPGRPSQTEGFEKASRGLTGDKTGRKRLNADIDRGKGAGGVGRVSEMMGNYPNREREGIGGQALRRFRAQSCLKIDTKGEFWWGGGRSRVTSASSWSPQGLAWNLSRNAGIFWKQPRGDKIQSLHLFFFGFRSLIPCSMPFDTHDDATPGSRPSFD